MTIDPKQPKPIGQGLLTRTIIWTISWRILLTLVILIALAGPGANLLQTLM